MKKKSVSDTGILFLLGSLAIGGSERKSILIANDLHQRGIPVHVAYLNKPDTLLDKIAPGIPVTCLHRKGKYSPKAQLRLASYVVSNRIGYVLTMNLYPLLYAFIARGLVRRHKFKLVAAINTTTHRSRKDTYSMALYAPLIRRADCIMFGCAYQRDMWIDKYNLPAHKSRVIYNGVDETHFSRSTLVQSDLLELRMRFGIGTGDVVVGTVGQLRPEKQQSDLVRAVARLNDLGYRAKLLIVGEGPKRETLVRLAGDLGISENVIFTGEMRDIRFPLALMDVFALASVSVETFSNAALEAMSMEVPVLLSDVGGAREMVREGYNGYIYEKSNMDQLSDCLEKLMLDKESRSMMAGNARYRIEHEFAFSRMVDQYQDLFAV